MVGLVRSNTGAAGTSRRWAYPTNQWLILRAPSEGPMNTLKVQRAAGLGEGQVYLAIQRLRSFGLVVSERKGRMQYHRLTEEGKAVAERAVKAVEAKLEVERILEGVLDKIVEATRLGVTIGEIERELRRYELELKKRKSE